MSSTNWAGQTRWNVLALETKQCLDNLRGSQYYYIRLYDGNDYPMQHRVGANNSSTWQTITNWVKATPENVALSKDFLDTKGPAGGTTPLPSIQWVLTSIGPPTQIDATRVPRAINLDQKAKRTSTFAPLGVNNGYGQGRHRYVQPQPGSAPPWSSPFSPGAALGGGGPVINHPTKPSEMMFLTDGSFGIISMTISNINVNPTVPINTICLGGFGAEVEMKQIAQDSGGVYRAVP